MLKVACFHVRSNNQCLRIDVKMIVMIELLVVMALQERMSLGWVDAAGQGLKEKKERLYFVFSCYPPSGVAIYVE